MTRSRSGQVHGYANGRIQRVPLHSAFKTSAIEPERDRTGRRSPGKLAPAVQAARALAEQVKRDANAASRPDVIPPYMVTAGGQIKKKGFNERIR